MITINGLFLDYDGTISPLEISREQSKVLPHIEAFLKVITKFIPIGVITTKDLQFIVPRTTFAHAWATIAGFETKVGNRISLSQEAETALPYLSGALEYVKENGYAGLVIEEKKNHKGQVMAFCVDWRQAGDQKTARTAAERILQYCKKQPLKVIEYPKKPYFDVFPCQIDKGAALNNLKQKLGISGGIIYMGDSATDNAAFKAADVSIGVSTSKEPTDLECQYWIKFDDIAFFLSSLFKKNFNFSPDLPGIRVRG